MALPRQVGLTITYDGTIQSTAEETVSESSSENNSGTTHTVVAADNLWSIAKKYYGSGTKYTDIYSVNAEVIEAVAKAHGKSSSNNGHWIYPGTVLTIPGISSGETKAATTTRTSIVKLGTANSELGNKMAEQANSFSYTDPASGESDSVSISLNDIGKEWMDSLMPQKGASFGAALNLTNWGEEEKEESFDCGAFILDDISFSGWPLSCVFAGVSVPAMDDFKSLPKTKTWEKTTIEEIASEIAKSAGVSLYYDADTIRIAEMEQNKQTDSAFLYSLCEKYGLAMKVYNHKIIIFDIVAYEEKDAVLTLSNTELLSGWSYNTTIDGTYTGVTLSYTDPDSDETISVTMGTEGKMYSINGQASSKYDAELQAAAKANAANRKIETMSVPITANIKIVAGLCIEIAGLGKANGKYYVDKVKHSIGSGYKMTLTLHKVQTPIKVTQPVAAASESGGGTGYTIVAGDTLWAIAKKFYGSGAKCTVIYNANTEVIEAAAKAHGKSSSNNGHWIYPGTVLTIPEV